MLCQVDQLVLEELAREGFHKLGPSFLYSISLLSKIAREYQHLLVFDAFMYLFFCIAVNHLDHLGVLVAWVTGPWFLSIFVNILPWESGQALYNLISIFFLKISSFWLFPYFYLFPPSTFIHIFQYCDI